jgi:RHS repeat-associated protein
MPGQRFPRWPGVSRQTYGYDARAMVTMSYAGGFSSKERDAETGLDFFGARYDSSAQGRFMSPDSHTGVPGNPQSWNKYSYTFNNPLKLVDPDGHFPTPAHIQWSTTGLQGLGFSNAASFATAVNKTVDSTYFTANFLHGMSGDSAYQGARWGLLSIAAHGGSTPGESAVALVMGMHLVQDYQAHNGLTSLLGHFLRFGVGDADPHSKSGAAAQGATQSFADDFMKMLIANYGEDGAKEVLKRMENASSQMMGPGSTGKGIEHAIGEISSDIQSPATDWRTVGPRSHVEEDAQQQCANGNPAACPVH